jgi:copper chaperone NosL
MKRLVANALLVLGVACQSASDAPNEPVWNKQACSSCAMLISEPKFAAQLVTTAGDHHFFDDVGCMAAFMARKKDAPKQAWVRAPEGNWVTVDHARFSKGAKTPMDYGFEFAETGELTWAAIQDAARQRLAHGSER